MSLYHDFKDMAAKVATRLAEADSLEIGGDVTVAVDFLPEDGPNCARGKVIWGCTWCPDGPPKFLGDSGNTATQFRRTTVSNFLDGIYIRVANHAINRWKERIDPAPIGKSELNCLARRAEEPTRDLLALLELGDATRIGLRAGDPPLYGVVNDRDAVLIFQPQGEDTVLLVTCIRKSVVQAKGRRWKRIMRKG